KSGKPSPLYLFLGMERYLQREAVNALKQTLLEESSSMLNFAEFSIAGHGVDEMLTVAEQYPMFGGHRLVIAHDFEKLADGELDALKNYLKNPQPTTTLVFQIESLDKRRNVSTALIKSCTLVEFNPLKEREAAEWA